MPSHLIRFAAVFTLLAGAAFAQEPQPQPEPAGDFEQPPVLAASAVLRPEFLKGAHFTVRPEAPTYSGRNQYMIDSDFGVFEADGNTMLVQRLAEIDAIAKLREVSRSDEYKSALKKAAQSPVNMAKSLVNQPVKTVSGVPKGLWKYMNRAGQSLKEKTEKRERSPYEDSAAKDLIGFSKVKRSMAAQLGVDPYSTNESLQQELNGIGWAAYGGSMTMNVALAPVGGGAGAAISAFNLADSSTQALRDMSPNDLRRASQGKLLEMGVERSLATTFLNNPAFSPTHQTKLVAALASMRKVPGRGEFLRLASEATDEVDALYYQRCAQVIAALHAQTPLSAVGSFNGLPMCISKEGVAIIPLEWDYAPYTEMAARFISDLKTANFGKRKITGFRVVLTGIASPRAKEALTKEGIELTEKALPGPLL